MIPGVRGRLITGSFARDELRAMSGFTAIPPHVSSRLHAWSMRLESRLGPASSIRTIADVTLVPLLELLGLCVSRREDTPDLCTLEVAAGSAPLIAYVAPYGEPVERRWRAAVTEAIAGDTRWALCCNGKVLRVVDARRTWTREYLEFDLALLGSDGDAQSMFWALLRRDAFDGPSPLLDRAIESSSRHGMAVCTSLGGGMLEALDVLLAALTARARPRVTMALFEQALTVLYRVLFLLFAEARGLMPIWHPVYRDRYSLEAIVATLLTGRNYRGLWHTIRAISRLAHTGFAAGELRVTAFNGRLFAPAQSDVFDGTPVSDMALSRAVLAVSTTPVNRHGRRARIAYRDLDVEQLGAVYERVLEYEPSTSARHALTRTRDLRKASASFYTPRAVTASLVRRTLAPLVRGKRADEILTLRILDPAMGSGACLVAACRFLGTAVEEALIAEGRWHPHDITAGDRASLRREIASRCLFGVDLNPMAVQLARLSLWLSTLAADKPLSFLDHHLLTGNSLVGATPDDLWRLPARPSGRRREALPLFDRAGLTAAFEHAVGLRLTLASQPDDTAGIVRAKEQALAGLHARDSSLQRWSRALDLWCARWFWDDGDPPDRRLFRDLASRVLTERSALPDQVAVPILAAADAVAATQRFVHWPLAFPEVFVDRQGESLADPGFDAVLGNPPWDMVRGDSGAGDRRQARRDGARRLTSFVRESGIYAVSAQAHANLYQWFVERALQLARRGGRIGFVLPSGFATDAGTAPLRRFVFDRADVDSITGLDNREGIFPIHRSVRFDLVTCTTGRPTTAIACRFGLTRPDQLERDDRSAECAPVILTRALLARLTGEDDLGIPELGGERDLAIVERISTTVPRLGQPDGWHVTFGRELNATDDRDCFEPYVATSGARPVVEGKQIAPFRVSLVKCRRQVRPDAADLAIPRRARLAYRDVASATNRLTLIATLVPAYAVTTHTLFCLKTRLTLAEQQVLCGLMNSFVANYLVRLRVNTHVTVALVSRLPVPMVKEGHSLFDRIRALTDTLLHASSAVEEMQEYAELQALAAHAYGLRREEFEHVLKTFPLIPAMVRRDALERFSATS